MPSFSFFPRVLKRRVLRTARQFLRCPDAWGDIIEHLNTHPTTTYLDIGAHTGGTVQRVYDECANPIVAFEPTEESRRKLEDRFGASPKVSIEPFALSEHSGRATFHLNANSQTNSLLDNAEGNMRSFPDDVRHLSQVCIQTLTLDDWRAQSLIDGPFFLKLDVQGSELAALRGADQTLDHINGIYAECPLLPMYRNQGDFWQIHDFLIQKGFDLNEIYPCLKDRYGRACQTDALWLRKS